MELLNVAADDIETYSQDLIDVATTPKPVIRGVASMVLAIRDLDSIYEDMMIDDLERFEIMQNRADFLLNIISAFEGMRVICIRSKYLDDQVMNVLINIAFVVQRIYTTIYNLSSLNTKEKEVSYAE
ncbi:hypothetical protein [uncultured Prevotella sp.]|uniref:hypothetical protein n=1 Tax=uncultured Prevotella sp. TaxID=159272 RepID=UPI00259B6023|nr:hypothetical protein [uncultured Prevotella sp.]